MALVPYKILIQQDFITLKKWSITSFNFLQGKEWALMGTKEHSLCTRRWPQTQTISEKYLSTLRCGFFLKPLNQQLVNDFETKTVYSKNSGRSISARYFSTQTNFEYYLMLMNNTFSNNASLYRLPTLLVRTFHQSKLWKMHVW